MKCAAIKLASRVEQPKKRTWKENATPRFAGEEGHSYSFPFLRAKTTKASKTEKPTTLAITTINLPDDVRCFNTGTSLDKWSKKRARLKSGKLPKTPEFDKDFCYETLETDLSLLLNDAEDRRSRDGSLDNLQYEVHTDIEKLLQESERNGDDKDQKKRRKKRGKDKKKAIRFSKPPSPQTEQVIRVDVTSNVSANEDKKRAHDARKMEEDRDAKEKIDKKNELIRNLSEIREEMCDEDFIVKCRQLALKHRRRRWR